jgi:hypothetical protein
MVFWDQSENQLPKIFKIPALGRQDHNRQRVFQPFDLNF